MGDHVLGFIGKQLLSTFGVVINATDTMPSHKVLDIPFFTEYDRQGTIYRAHPNYRGQNPYYDWAYVRYLFDATRITGQETVHNIIGRILGFFRHPDGELMAVVHSCKLDTAEQHGVMGTFYHLEFHNAADPRPALTMVTVDCLEQHACMIPYKEDDPYMWIHVWDPIDWPGCFQQIEPPSE
jgi:hypothetical protein